MKHSNRQYRTRLAQFVFAVAAITSGTNALAKEPPFKYVLLPVDHSYELCEMDDSAEICLGPIRATAAGQNCIKNGGKVVVEMRAGKRAALCRTAATTQSPPRTVLKPPPGGDGSPGPYDQGGGPEGKTLPVKPSPISPAQSSSVYCRSGSPPPCPPTGTVGSDATQAKEKLRATTKTQGDFLGARTSPPGLPPPIVSESKTIKPPYSPTNPAPMDSKDPK